MNIVTNNQRRELQPIYSVPHKFHKDFNYIKGNAIYLRRFVQYKGAWYDTYDTQRIVTDQPNRMGWAMHVESTSPFAKWNAVLSETFFSGVLFRFVGDDEVICGSYYS
jgi:hypothetical protein